MPFLTNDSPGFSPNLHPQLSKNAPYHNVMELNKDSIIVYVLSPKYCVLMLPFEDGVPVEVNALNMDIQFEEAPLDLIERINKGVCYTRYKLVISNSKKNIIKFTKGGL